MHLVAVVQTDIGNVRFLDGNKIIQDDVSNETIFETFSEANSIASSKKNKVSEDKKENEKYDLRVIPLSLILLQLSQTKIKQLIFSLEPDQIVKGQTK